MRFAEPSDTAIALHVLAREAVASWLEGQDDFTRRYLEQQPFSGALGAVCVLPDASGAIDRVLVGWGSARERAREQYPFGAVRAKLPRGTYHIASGLAGDEMETAALAWLLSGYRFARYKAATPPEAVLVAPKGVDAARIETEAAGVALASDLINTPAADMGPEALEAAATDLARRHGAGISVTRGAELLAANFPMIHAVGRAAAQQPRLIDMTWGKADGPRVTLVGKGVCFDTGGLNLKPGASMSLMKKDMGGAATVLGLASMIMALDLPVRLRVLIPAVENSVSATSFRPGDVLTSRKGLTVEINNTDAEGRLVLADALALADEESPDLLVCMATLTGAARVALGPDLPPYYTDDDALAAMLDAASRAAPDPLWRMPFWDAYEPMIEPDIADLDNAPSGGFAGSITAALFLRRFVERAESFVHLDCYAWTPSSKPARPKGGTAQGARALLRVIESRFLG